MLNNNKIKHRKKAKSACLDLLYLSFPFALFLFGGELIRLGANAAYLQIYSFLIALIVAFLALWGVQRGASSIFGYRHVSDIRGAFHKIVFVIFSLLGIALSCGTLYKCLSELGEFASRIMLLRAPYKLLTAFFLLFCTFLASKGRAVIKKYSLIALILTLLGGILLLLFGLPSLEFGNIKLKFPKSIDVRGILSVLLGVFTVCFLLQLQNLLRAGNPSTLAEDLFDIFRVDYFPFQQYLSQRIVA